jgi:hypothetical protein
MHGIPRLFAVKAGGIIAPSGQAVVLRGGEKLGAIASQHNKIIGIRECLRILTILFDLGAVIN